MKSVTLAPEDHRYPAALQQRSGDKTPPHLSTLGNLDILHTKKLGLFCSVKCPGRLILRTYDLAQHLREAGVTVVSGFHSPIEKECLRLLLRGTQPIIICPARSLEGMRLPAEWKEPLGTGRLLLLSIFATNHRRADDRLVSRRNELVVRLADKVFLAYASPGGKTEQLRQTALAQSRQLFTLADSEQEPSDVSGIEQIEAQNPAKLLTGLI